MFFFYFVFLFFLFFFFFFSSRRRHTRCLSDWSSDVCSSDLIGFSICSSRPPFGLRMMIEPLRLALPFGGYNAGAIVEPDLSVVEQKLIPPDAAREAVAMFQQYCIDCWVFVGNQWLIVNPTGDHVDHE